MNRLKTKYWHSRIQRPYWFSIQNMNTIIPRRIAQGLISWFLMQNMNAHPQKDSCKVWSYTVGRSDDMAWPNKSPSTQESHLPTLPDKMELFQIFGKRIDNVSKKHGNLFTSVSKSSKPWPLARSGWIQIFQKWFQKFEDIINILSHIWRHQHKWIYYEKPAVPPTTLVPAGLLLPLPCFPHWNVW